MAKRIKDDESKGDSVTTAVWNAIKVAKSDHLKFENFTGTYRDNWFGEITITKKGSVLWFTSKRSPKLNVQMSYYKGNTFAIRWEYQSMTRCIRYLFAG
jgi:hypothetical protein